MGVMSAIRNLVTGRGLPYVTGTMATAEVDRLNALLNEVPTTRERQILNAHRIHSIQGTYRGPNYALEEVSGTRCNGTSHETVFADQSGNVRALFHMDQQPSQEIDPRSVDGADFIAKVLSAIHARARLQHIGGAL